MSYLSSEDDHDRPWCPPVDVYRSENHYVVKADLPGLDIESINVKATGNTLAISGNRDFQAGEETREHLRLERIHGKFVCELHLPKMAADQALNVDYQQGVLQIEVPIK